jgi:hypothetical protein
MLQAHDVGRSPLRRNLIWLTSNAAPYKPPSLRRAWMRFGALVLSVG